MDRSRGRQGKGYYFDFVRLKGYFDRRMPMATPSVSHIFALQAQLRRIEAGGFEERYARHRAMAEVVRSWAEARFELFAAAGFRSDTVTCVREPRGGDLAALLKAVARRGYAVGSGYGRLKETTFRIGHMGDHTVDGVRALLGVIDGVLAEAGR
jgi:aspartate aminotransferase-like enzyme